MDSVRVDSATTALSPLFMKTDDPSDPKGYPNASITKTIYCQNSGVTLGRLDVCIFEGHLAYMEAHNEAVYLHPFYRLSNIVLIKKLEDALHHAQENGWVLSWREQERVQLLVSAIMHSFGCVKQDQASLPKFQIAAGSAGRLLGLAKWFYFLSSQRFEFPQYSISKRNENLGWENYKFWLDSAFKIRENWSKQKKHNELDAQRRAHEVALKEIKDDNVYKRLDLRKIWRWIQLQLEEHYSPGRIKTFEDLFLNGDLEIHNWINDDIDDLSEAILEHCDAGNDIMYFIRKRLDGFLALARDFREGFTIIGGAKGRFTDDKPTPEEELFIGEYDKKVDALEELPPPPKRESFETQGLFIRAQAQWNILKRRFDARKGQQS